eukprot:6710691-Prymnesium_polylepis.1
MGHALVVMEEVGRHSAHALRTEPARVYAHARTTSAPATADPTDTAEEQELVAMLSLTAQRATDRSEETVLALLTRVNDGMLANGLPSAGRE